MAPMAAADDSSAGILRQEKARRLPIVTKTNSLIRLTTYPSILKAASTLRTLAMAVPNRVDAVRGAGMASVTLASGTVGVGIGKNSWNEKGPQASVDPPAGTHR